MKRRSLARKDETFRVDTSGERNPNTLRIDANREKISNAKLFKFRREDADSSLGPRMRLSPWDAVFGLAAAIDVRGFDIRLAVEAKCQVIEDALASVALIESYFTTRSEGLIRGC
jgi:hypothetical protein